MWVARGLSLAVFVMQIEDEFDLFPLLIFVRWQPERLAVRYGAERRLHESLEQFARAIIHRYWLRQKGSISFQLETHADDHIRIRRLSRRRPAPRELSA